MSFFAQFKFYFILSYKLREKFLTNQILTKSQFVNVRCFYSKMFLYLWLSFH